MTDPAIRPDPFPHVVADGLFPAAEVLAAAESWPRHDWDGWYCYGSAQGSKSVSDMRGPIPPACAALLCRMALLPVGEWLGVSGLVPDLGLWGSGLHSIPPGPGLPTHMDADHHCRLGLARRATMTLYLPPWQDDWGGELELLDVEGNVRAFVGPAPGRLVIFLNVTKAFHRVRPVTGPLPRRSLSLFFYGTAGPRLRPRAAWGGVG